MGNFCMKTRFGIGLKMIKQTFTILLMSAFEEVGAEVIWVMIAHSISEYTDHRFLLKKTFH